MTKSKQFDDWLKEIDNEVNFTFGITLEELPDFNWYSYYNYEYTPIEALDAFFRSGESVEDFTEEPLSA